MSTIARLQTWPRRAVRAVGAMLLPATCCMCGFPGVRAGLDLCEVCIGVLPANAHSWDYSPIFSRALVPFQYAYPVDRFVRALKFRGERLYARVLGTLLADAHWKRGGPLPQLLIPVPLHSSRYRKRGFNQAYEIARFAAGALGARVDASILTRVIATQEQSGLPLAERHRNVRRAFRAACPPSVQHVALIDDVLTTGNTTEEAARALNYAGVKEIELWCVARAILRGPASSTYVMQLITPCIEQIRELMTWFTDKPAVRMWGGPAFRYPFTEESFLEDMYWGRMATYALTDDSGAMAGFGQLYVKAERAHLARLAVAPSRRGVGNGHMLVRLLIDKGRELFPCTENSLYVMRANERALHCYLQAGFVEVPVPAGERSYPDQIFMVRKAG